MRAFRAYKRMNDWCYVRTPGPLSDQGAMWIEECLARKYGQTEVTQDSDQTIFEFRTIGIRSGPKGCERIFRNCLQRFLNKPGGLNAMKLRKHKRR